MATGVTTIVDLAQQVLNAVTAGFAGFGVLLPAEQFLYYGDRPVALCPCLVVTWERNWLGKAGTNEQLAEILVGKHLVGKFGVWIMRCVTTPGDGVAALTQPTAAQMSADAHTIMTDGYTLAKVLFQADKAGAFDDWCRGIALGPCVPMPVEGGVGGVYMTLDLDLY